MKNRCIYLLLFFIFFSCKKGTLETAAGNDIISLLFNKGTISTLNKEKKEVVVEIADFIDRKSLVAIFHLSEGAVATVSGVQQFSSTTPNDFTNPVIYTITSADGKSVGWTVRMQSNNKRIGLNGVVSEEKRLIREYEWYRSQDTTGRYSRINGGAACIAMALKWLDHRKYPFPDITEIRQVSTSVLRPEDPSHILPPEAVSHYFDEKAVVYKLINLTSDTRDVTEHIDRGNLIILLVDFAKIPYNEIEEQYTNRFYPLNSTFATTGHWIIVKGYKRVNNILYYETYDPFSNGKKYQNGELKGRNRYYNSDYINAGFKGSNGWSYAYIILKDQVPSNEVLRNEVYMPYYGVDLPDDKYGYIPRMGTLVSYAVGY